MTDQVNANNDQEKGSAFEWWMVSFIAGGAGWAAFISLLIPPFVTGPVPQLPLQWRQASP